MLQGDAKFFGCTLGFYRPMGFLDEFLAGTRIFGISGIGIGILVGTMVSSGFNRVQS